MKHIKSLFNLDVLHSLISSNTNESYRRHDKATMNWYREHLAYCGFLLPILAPLAGFIAYEKNGPTFWWSLSATFYATSAILFIFTLSVFSSFLWGYKGYDLGDLFTCRFSAVMAALVMAFPCDCEAAGETTGIFNLPTPISHIIHCIVASLLFLSFAYMVGFRFTKTDKNSIMTEDKKKRNKVYKICAIIIAAAMANQVLTSILDIGWFTIINEAIMLWSFSFAWLVKSNKVTKFRDKVTDISTKEKVAA